MEPRQQHACRLPLYLVDFALVRLFVCVCAISDVCVCLCRYTCVLLSSTCGTHTVGLTAAYDTAKKAQKSFLSSIPVQLQPTQENTHAGQIYDKLEKDYFSGAIGSSRLSWTPTAVLAVVCAVRGVVFYYIPGGANSGVGDIKLDTVLFTAEVGEREGREVEHTSTKGHAHTRARTHMPAYNSLA